MPVPVRVHDLAGIEIDFVIHRSTAFDIIAKVNIRSLVSLSRFYDRENHPGSQRALFHARVIKRIDQGVSVGERVHIADGNQLVVEIMTPALNRKWVVRKRPEMKERLTGLGFSQPTSSERAW